MTKFVLRHWRGNGQIIPDVMKEEYNDYPKYRNIRAYKLKDCLYKIISSEEYLTTVLTRYGVESHNKKVRQYRLGKERLILTP